VGRVTSASVLRSDGSTDYFGSWQDATEAARRDLVELEYDYGPHLLPVQSQPARGMWRYSGLLPLTSEQIRYPVVVGGTPLVNSVRLQATSGMAHLLVKDETRGPTGSMKDRATALVLEHGLRNGADTVTCASSGNIATSLAVGAAACGIRAVVFVPASVGLAKLTLMLLSKATVFKVTEGYEAAFTLSNRAASHYGWLNRNTGINPMTIEAKKTVGLEIWEQLGHQVPDVVVVPVGDGPTLCGVAKAFRELVACGAATRQPRLIGVQAAGCQPLKVAWETGQLPRATATNTIADGIAVAAPVSAPQVLRDIRQSGGAFVSVTDAEMLEAIRTLAENAGLVAEPAGAAGYAGVGAAVRSGLLDSGERTVVLLTGTGLKIPNALQPVTTAREISASVEDLARELGTDA
jgi:threonine synthase